MRPRIRADLYRQPDSHKGDYGHVLIVAGSRGMTGAAVLTAEAATRSGAGKVTLAVPESIYPAVARRVLEVMTLPVKACSAGSFGGGAVRPILNFAFTVDAVAVGPGLSRHPETGRLVRALWVKSVVPLVVDADGLYALAKSRELNGMRRRGAAVLTPHDGEFARLSGKKPPKELASRKRV